MLINKIYIKVIKKRIIWARIRIIKLKDNFKLYKLFLLINLDTIMS